MVNSNLIYLYFIAYKNNITILHFGVQLSWLERGPDKTEVKGSIPFTPTINTGMWLSLVERLVWDQDAAGSSPVIPTIDIYSNLFYKKSMGSNPIESYYSFFGGIGLRV